MTHRRTIITALILSAGFLALSADARTAIQNKGSDT